MTDGLGKDPIKVSASQHDYFVVFQNESDIKGLNPDMNLLKMLDRNGVIVTAKGKEADFVSRFFAPAVGVNEDPVTGNANGPLGAYLVYHKLVPHDGKRLFFKGMQGEAINRTGHVSITVDIEDDNPIRTKVGGQAVVVFKTEIKL